MEYKKSYKGFWIWLILFFAITLAIGSLPIEDVSLLLRLLLNETAWAVVALTAMVCAGDKAYWYNGVSFEEARDAGPERRRKYARRHLKRFVVFAATLLVFSGIAQATGISMWADLAVFLAGMIGVAVSTVSIRL